MLGFFKYIVLFSTTLSLYSVEATQDRRCRFYDLAKVSKDDRKPKSAIIQFYSSSDNIGNYLPVLGIQQMLGLETDVWSMHDKEIDFDFINKNYSGAIIGGAGLLNACFEPFWQKLQDQCTLPMIMWGLGICLPYKHGDKAVGVNKQIVQAIAKKCDLINVRDHLTADYYQLENVDISPCPTVVYLQKFKQHVKPDNSVLYSAHGVSVGKDRTKLIINKLRQAIPDIKIIDNIQHEDLGLEDYIREYYCKSSLVITSRLHGAIIAYGLDIPCIMLPGDLKLDSFYQTYGFGNWALTVNDCLDLLSKKSIPIGKPLNLEPVLVFGQRAYEWMQRVVKEKEN